MSTLYEITDDLLALDALLEESGGEVTEEVTAWMAEYGLQLASKVDRIGAFIRECEARGVACKAEEDRLALRRRVQDNKVKSLKALAGLAMERLAVTRLDGQTFTLAIQQNGGKRPVRLLDARPENYPEDCRKITVAVDEDAVRAHLEADTLPYGLAYLGKPGTHVRLR